MFRDRPEPRPPSPRASSERCQDCSTPLPARPLPARSANMRHAGQRSVSSQLTPRRHATSHTRDIAQKDTPGWADTHAARVSNFHTSRCSRSRPTHAHTCNPVAADIPGWHTNTRCTVRYPGGTLIARTHLSIGGSSVTLLRIRPPLRRRRAVRRQHQPSRVAFRPSRQQRYGTRRERLAARSVAPRQARGGAREVPLWVVWRDGPARKESPVPRFTKPHTTWTKNAGDGALGSLELVKSGGVHPAANSGLFV